MALENLNGLQCYRKSSCANKSKCSRNHIGTQIQEPFARRKNQVRQCQRAEQTPD